jgi:hypothetical protein
MHDGCTILIIDPFFSIRHLFSIDFHIHVFIVMPVSFLGPPHLQFISLSFPSLPRLLYFYRAAPHRSYRNECLTYTNIES